MTQERRKDEQRPDRPLDWDDTEPLAVQVWNAPATPSPAKVDLSGLMPPEPGYSDSLPDRIFNLPCKWRGAPELADAVRLGHTMACEQAYVLAHQHFATPSPSLPPLQGAAVPAEPAAHVVDIDRNTNESIIDAALEPGTALYAAPASAAAAPQPLAFFQALVTYKNSDRTLADDQRFADAVLGAAAAPLLMDEREAFEAAYVSKYPTVLFAMPEKFDRDECDNYIDGAVFVAWDLWQARATLGASPQPLTDEQIDDMWRDATEHGGDTTQAYVRYFARLIQSASPSPKLPEGCEAGGAALSEARAYELVAAHEIKGELFGHAVFDAEGALNLIRAVEQEVERRCRAQPDSGKALLSVPAWVYRSARELAVSIWRDNYKEDAPQFEPLDDLAGVISQIDNMVSGMSRCRAQRTNNEVSTIKESLNVATPAPAPADGDARDAARYRWLCHMSDVTRLPALVEWCASKDGGTYVADGKPSIDAAIDAAMTPPVSSGVVGEVTKP